MSAVTSNKQITTGIVLSLALWGVYLAVGATGYFTDKSLMNPVKSLIVLAFVAMFLGLWAFVIRATKHQTGQSHARLSESAKLTGESNAADPIQSIPSKRAWNTPALGSVGAVAVGFVFWGIALATWKSVSLEATTVLGWLAALSIVSACSLGMIALSDRKCLRGKWFGLLGLLGTIVAVIGFLGRMTPT